MSTSYCVMQAPGPLATSVSFCEPGAAQVNTASAWSGFETRRPFVPLHLNDMRCEEGTA